MARTPRSRTRLLNVAVRTRSAGSWACIAWSLKVEIHGWPHVEAALATGRPLILATWHGNILSVFLLRFAFVCPC
jgi:lauroyl/myristoyl acyltransferase